MTNQPERPPIPKPPKQFSALKKPGKPETESPKQVDKNIAKPSIKNIKTLGNVMAVVGALLASVILINFDTTICEKGYLGGEYNCVHNTGEIGKKNNLIMYFGIMFIGGCVLMKD